MSNEIERKFLVKTMPDLACIKPEKFERYFIFKRGNAELRIQRRDNVYELERKETLNNLKAVKSVLTITKAEFEKLKQLQIGSAIIRDSYNLSSNPDISIKIYHGDYEGLKRVEVEFHSETDAKSFKAPDWFGKEITGWPVSRDSGLLDITREQLLDLIK